MKKLVVKASVTLLALLSITGCASSQTQSTPQADVPITGFNSGGYGTVVSMPNILNYDQMVRAAETYGLNASMVGPIQQPFFEPTGEIILVQGQEVQVFQFANASDVKQALSQIPVVGTRVAGTPVVNVEPMHVWSGGNLIALYSGQDARVIGFLNAAFGPRRY